MNLGYHPCSPLHPYYFRHRPEQAILSFLRLRMPGNVTEYVLPSSLINYPIFSFCVLFSIEPPLLFQTNYFTNQKEPITWR
jgi:hypothetical protein